MYIYFPFIIASQAGDKDRMRLMASVTHMNGISSKTVSHTIILMKEN